MHARKCANAKTTPDTPPTLALSDFSEKDKKWDMQRGKTQTIGTLYDAQGRYARLGERMGKCSTTLSFAESIHPETGECGLKLRNAMFCKVRHCPVCQWRRGLRNVARFYERMPLVVAAYPQSSWLFLTLTLRNPEMCDLRSTLNDMNKGWQRMIQRKAWPSQGFIRTTEITKGKDNNPHPHFHALLLVKPSYFQGGVYLSQQAWSEMWMDAMRLDYMPVVHVQKVKATSDKAKLAEANGDSLAALSAAVAETLKYSVKPEDMMTDPQFLYGITDQLKNLRFLATGGVLKDFLSDEISNDEMIQTTEKPEDETDDAPETPSLFFGWKTQDRKYRKITKN